MKESFTYEGLSPREKNSRLLDLYKQIPLADTMTPPLEEIDKRTKGKSGLELIQGAIDALMMIERRARSSSSRALLTEVDSLLKESHTTVIFQAILKGDFQGAFTVGRGKVHGFTMEIERILNDEHSGGIFDRQKGAEIEGKLLAEELQALGVDGIYWITPTLNHFSMRWWVQLYWRKHQRDPREFLLTFN